MHPFFDYVLPPGLIAQEPAAERDAARLLVVRRDAGTLAHRVFRDLPDLLDPGDLLVLNDTRVLPARLVGRRERTGGKWEGLFLRELPGGLWELLGRTKGHPEVGEAVVVEPGGLRLILTGRAGGHWLAAPDPPGTTSELLARHGRIPLPPYIRKGQAGDADRDRYQTVYARRGRLRRRPDGRAALHAGTVRPLGRARRRHGAGDAARRPRHVRAGQATTRPTTSCTASGPRCRPRRSRWSRVPGAGRAGRRGRHDGGAGLGDGGAGRGANRGRGETELFVRPPFDFRVLGGLVTNFHLPRTTLLLLVAAFAGSDLLRRAYEEAIGERYRFFSYGDAMLIL